MRQQPIVPTARRTSHTECDEQGLHLSAQNVLLATINAQTQPLLFHPTQMRSRGTGTRCFEFRRERYMNVEDHKSYRVKEGNYFAIGWPGRWPMDRVITRVCRIG